MAEHPTVAILWFRQDLRLSDNAALQAACAAADRVLPVYVLPDGPADWGLGGASAWWLHHSLASLAAALAEKGASLCLRRGKPADIIAGLAETHGAGTVHAGICAEPALRAQDDELAARLDRSGRALVLHRNARLFDPDGIRTKAGGIYGMYTPFANAVMAQGDPPAPLRTPKAIPGLDRAPPSDRLEDWGLLPAKPDWAGGLRDAWVPGEAAAQKRATWFVRDAAGGYDTGRNLPGQDLTARLSPHLHWGELSPVWLWHAIRRRQSRAGAQGGEAVFLRELIWREFAGYLLWHKPSMPDAPLRPGFEKLPWRRDRAQLRAWQQGRTGVPIVDAGMRQLWQTGWMHNRVRLITASFLVKHLLIDWREGETWFWDTLVDADLPNNSMNWQWMAGTGIDSQPFFRVFNPVSQGEKFDRDGAYVRHFVPELARLPDRHLHAPWGAPDTVLAEAGVTLGRDYPRLIVDLAAGRQRALDTYRRTVQSAAPGQDGVEDTA
jgi:deoxyribodipyrimidine photo-lyase